MDELLAWLFAAAVHFSGLPATEAPPPVEALPYESMLRTLCADLEEESRQLLAARRQCLRERAMWPEICRAGNTNPDPYSRCMRQRGLVAAYIIGERRIVYRDDLDLRYDADNSFIVHEFVHALQDHKFGGHAFDSCADTLAAEQQAYRVQQQYLRARGQLLVVGERLRRVSCDDLL